MPRPIGALFAVLLVAELAAPTFAEDKPESGGADRQAILALLKQVETGFDAADSKGLASCWTESGEFAGPGGARTDGRESIEKLFQDAFAARKGSKLQLHLLHLHLVSESLALVEAVADVKPAPATGGSPVADFVLVKKDGRWLIESAHEMIAHSPPDVNHLKELEWLIGNWSSETSKVGIALRTSCDWTANRTFLIRKFKVEGKEAILHGGTEVIGWDPRSSRIRSWVFDSDGGFGENVWVHDGNRWLIKYSGTLADGSEASATHVLTSVDANTVTLQSRDRVVNGTAEPDIPETELKRQVEAPPAKTDEPAKPVEKTKP